MSTRQFCKIVSWILFIGVGAAVYGLFAYAASGGDPNDVKCGWKPMSPGDVCWTRSSSKTYDELVVEKRDAVAWARTYGPPIAGVGAVIAFGCVLLLITRKSSSASSDTTAVDGTGTVWWSDGDKPS